MRIILPTFILIMIVSSLIVNPGCSSSRDKNISSDRINNTLQRKPPPSVNSAQVEAEIMNTAEKDDYLNSDLKILEVKYYGASVPPLAVGSIIKAEVSKSSIENSKLPKEELLKVGSQHIFTLEHYQLPANVTSPSWRVLSIE